MLNPYQYSGSYEDLLTRATRHAKQDEIDNQIVEILKQFLEKELDKEDRMFSRPERLRLFQDVSKAIMVDVLEKIGQIR